MKNIDEIRSAVDGLRDEIAELAELDEINAEQDERLDAAIGELEVREAELAKEEARAAVVARVNENRSVPRKAVEVPQVIKQVETRVDARSATDGELRDASLKIIEESRYLSPAQQENAERRLYKGDGGQIARKVVATESPEYRSAWQKSVTGQEHLLNDAERRAMVEARAMEVGTTTEGGFGVPVLIDPTVMITDGQGLLSLMPYVTIKTINTNAWKGVSAGHTAWSFDAEEAEVSDDTSTFAQPTVSVHAARGFIPFSIEIEQDYPGFASEMSKLLSDGYMDLLAEKLAVGTGSDQPFGVFATTTTTVDVTTDNTFGAEDIDAVWAALPEKFRARATWFMNVDVENDIRGFGSGTATSRFTVDQTAEGISLLNGRPVALSDHAPTWTGTDGAKILAVGDFSNYIVAQRAGMTVEYVPHLFATANNLPSGQRGWFAHARVGADLAVQNAVRVLKNITT